MGAAAIRHANHLLNGGLSHGNCSEDFAREDDHQARYDDGCCEDDHEDDCEEEEGLLLSSTGVSGTRVQALPDKQKHRSGWVGCRVSPEKASETFEVPKRSICQNQDGQFIPYLGSDFVLSSCLHSHAYALG